MALEIHLTTCGRWRRRYGMSSHQRRLRNTLQQWMIVCGPLKMQKGGIQSIKIVYIPLCDVYTNAHKPQSKLHKQQRSTWQVAVSGYFSRPQVHSCIIIDAWLRFRSLV